MQDSAVLPSCPLLSADHGKVCRASAGSCSQRRQEERGWIMAVPQGGSLRELSLHPDPPPPHLSSCWMLLALIPSIHILVPCSHSSFLSRSSSPSHSMLSISFLALFLLHSLPSPSPWHPHAPWTAQQCHTTPVPNHCC